jgi:hypothetical protein
MTTMNRHNRAALKAAWSLERTAARAAQNANEPQTEWGHLERAHILSQPTAWNHVRTHAAMLRHGLRRHDRREVIGQLARLLVAGPGTLTRRYPIGNTGGSNVSAMAIMPIPDDLRPILEAAGKT